MQINIQKTYILKDNSSILECLLGKKNFSLGRQKKWSINFMNSPLNLEKGNGN